MTGELFFVARFKDGYLLFLTDGPFTDQEQALAILAAKPKDRGRCYFEVVKTHLDVEIVVD